MNKSIPLIHFFVVITLVLYVQKHENEVSVEMNHRFIAGYG